MRKCTGRFPSRSGVVMSYNEPSKVIYQVFEFEVARSDGNGFVDNRMATCVSIISLQMHNNKDQT